MRRAGAKNEGRLGKRAEQTQEIKDCAGSARPGIKASGPRRGGAEDAPSAPAPRSDREDEAHHPRPAGLRGPG